MNYLARMKFFSAQTYALERTLVGAVLALCLIIAARSAITGNWRFLFLLWNIALAYVPLAAARHVWRIHIDGSAAHLAGWSILWLLFFPNTFYLVTDFIHLKQRGTVVVWLDMLLLFLAALIGVVTGVASLQCMARVWGRMVTAGWRFVFVPSIAILTAFGIFVGRFLRWNSWHIVTNPTVIVQDLKALFFLNSAEYGAAALFLSATALVIATSYALWEGMCAVPWLKDESREESVPDSKQKPR